MPPNQTISEIKDIISDPDSQLPTKTGLRLLLTVSSEMWEQMENINKSIKEIAEKQVKQQEDIKELQSHNILLWVQRNPKWAISTLILFIVIVDMVVDMMSFSVAWKYLEEILLRSVGI